MLSVRLGGNEIRSSRGDRGPDTCQLFYPLTFKVVGTDDN
jgi:hypothetical protein